MTLQDQQPEDIRATLAISQEEAQFGSKRVINLPDGLTTTVTIPAGACDGQELRLKGYGIKGGASGLAGDLVLRISVIAPGNVQVSVEDHFATQRVSYQGPNAPASADVSLDRGRSARPAFASPVQEFFASACTEPANGGVPVRPSPYPASGGYPNAPVGQPYANYGARPASSPAQPGEAVPNPGYGGYSPYPTYNQPSQTNQPISVPRPKRNGAMTALILAIVVVLIAGSGLIFYLGYYQPYQRQTIASQQTATAAQAAATGTARTAQATASAAARSTAQSQATAQAYQSIYTQATGGTPVLDDPLSVPMLNPLWNITLGSTANGACEFTGGSYHSTIPNAGFFQPCYALTTNYSTFAFQVDMTIVQGDQGGVLLRANTAHTKFYLFRLSVDGTFDLYNYTNVQGSQAILLLTGTSKAMKGLNQSNEITVVAQSTTMYLYLNKQYVGSSNDNTYTAGEIGVFAESAKNSTDVAFSNAKVWTL